MIVAILLLLIVVSIPAWCRRRNVGIMTWAFRMIPLLAILDPLIGCRFSGFAWVLSMILFSLIRESLLLACAAQAEPAAIPDETPESHTVKGVTYPYLRQFSDEEKIPPRAR